ncbi:MAG: T9SS type A sorting domain-containing protein [Bacteroidota bacterium]|nr:T9SS type A sorting domain-containing protein [Candidatus Kapabacteria bacterium]MDW8219379.1 T9SS type A sorting domain-containing protein [Bacteroidota bacterium]
MNSLHSATRQRTPVRGVALCAFDEAERGSALNSAVHARASLEVLEAMQQNISMLQRIFRSILKATRATARMTHVWISLLMVCTLVGMTNAATFFRVGSGAWNNPALWSTTSGGAGGAGVPGITDVAIFDNLSGNPTISFGGAMFQVGRVVVQSNVIVTLSDAAASTLSLNGIMGDAINAPLIVAPNSTLVVGSNITLAISANAGSAPVAARIFGSISVAATGFPGTFGAIQNAVAQNFSVEDGGALRMSGGTYNGPIQYALSGARGSLVYDRPDNVTQTVPMPGTNEVAMMLGNLVVRRSVSAVTQLTPANYNLHGTLTVENVVSVLSIPPGTVVTMAASRMIAGGTITTVNNPAMPIELIYEELNTMNPVGATTSELAFTGPAMLTRLRNRVATLNVSINSDMQIFGSAMSGLEVADAGATAGLNQGGRVTISAGRRVTLRNNSVSHIGNFTTARLIVNGTLIISTGSTLNNTNVSGTGTSSGLVIGSGGRIQFWGSAQQITPGSGNTFYTDATSVADYQDADFMTFAARPTTPQEIPTTMNGSITVNRIGTPTLDLNMVLLNNSVTMNGNLNLVSGGIGMNGNRMILNGTVTLGTGGYIAGSNAASASAFLYNGTVPTSVRTTSSTFVVFNHFGVTNTGNLTLSGQVIIDGSTYTAAYDMMGAPNNNGQLVLSNTGNLVCNAATLIFRGMNGYGAGVGQGGHIPVTNTGAISGDTGSQIIFESPQARSYLRMASGGQVLANLYVQPAAAGVTDYLVSLRTPLSVTSAPALTLNGNAVLQLGPGADLTLSNAVIAGGAPNTMGNFIDASQGGRLIIQNMGVAAYTFPVGVNTGAGPARYLPITINNPTPNETYIVSVTTAIVNVPSIPSNLTTRSVNAQWTISKGTPSYNGPLTLQWNTADEPVPFNTSLTADPSLTTIRRWTGASYANVLPTMLPVIGPPRTLQATFNGSLSNTIFIVSNALFPIYWVGGNNTDWGNTLNWASSSNGTPGSAAPPGINDWAIFDRSIDAPVISTNIPASIQRLTVMGGASPTFAQPTTLNLRQTMVMADKDVFFGESLHIATGSTLTLGGTNLSIAPTVAGNHERGIVFGTLRINPGSTLNHTVNMNTAEFVVASAGTLQMAGGTFTKGMMTTLLYNTPAPYTALSPSTPAILAYADALSTAVTTTPAATNEWGAPSPVTLPASLLINRTGANRDFIISTMGGVSVTVRNNITVQSGRFIIGPNMTLIAGPAPTSQVSVVSAVAPNGTFVGSNDGAMTPSELIINGQGPSTLRFASDNELERYLGRLTIGQTLTMGQAPPRVTLSSGRNLTLVAANGLNIVSADNSFGLIIASTDTLTLYRDVNAASIGAGSRVLVNGRLRLAGETVMPFPSLNNAGALAVGTTCTLDLICVGLGAVTGNPVEYLAPTSTLRYGGQRTVSTSPIEFPHLFNGTLIVQKGFSNGDPTLPGINDNLVQIDANKTLSGASIQLLNGGIDLHTAGVRFTMNAPLNSPSPLGMFRVGMGMASDGCIEYNNSTPATLRFDASGGAPFIGCLTITGATVTLASGTSATFEAATAITDAGRLFLDGTANLQMNGNSLSFTGNNTVGGFIRSGSGVLSGSASSNLTFTSPRRSVVRMNSMANQLNNMTVNSTFPVTNPLVVITTSTVVNGTLTLNSTNWGPGTGGGNIRLEPNVQFTVNATNATHTPVADNNFIETAAGSRLIMPIAAGAWRSFPVGTTNTLGTALLYAPVAIYNGSAASDFYSVNASHTITHQSTTYPQRVNVQWTVNKNSGTSTGDKMIYTWEVSHESPGFVRANGFPARWNGTGYDNLLNAALGGASMIGIGTYYSATSVNPITSYSNTPFVVLNPPSAIILAASNTSPTGNNGFNPTPPTSFGTPNLTITSGTPFPIHFSAFNGLNQLSPVVASFTVFGQLISAPGQTAVFNTSGTVSTTLDPALGRPVSSTMSSIVFDWLNPGNAASTTAILRLYEPTGTLTSASLVVTVLAPPLRPSTIAYSQVQNASTGTLGFNGGGLGQFNITGGISFPINFGLYSNSNFLAPTTATTVFETTIEPIPGLTMPSANFVATPSTPQAPTTATLNAGVATGSVRPIFNWTNPPGNGPAITKALVRLRVLSGGEPGSPVLASTTVTVTISTTGTVFPVPGASKLGYSVNSGDILDPALSNQGINNGAFTMSNPIMSNSVIRVNFASFADYGAVIRPSINPTQVQLSIAPVNPTDVFSIDGTTATTITSDGTGSLFPRIIHNDNAPAVKPAILTLSVVSGQTTLLSTTAQIWVATTGSIATHTSFNPNVGISGHTSPAIGSAGINGGNLTIPSGRPFNIDFGFFNAASVLALGGGNPMTLSIVNVVPGTETVTLSGNTAVPLIFGARQARLEGARLNWINPTVPGPIQVTIRLTPSNPPLIFSGISFTEATITLTTGASVPVALAMSQISSTGTQGVNGGNLTINNGVPFNINLGLFDAFGVPSPSLSNISVGLSAQPVIPGQTFTVSGGFSGVFVNQSGITLNNVIVTWTNPSSPTTQVQLVVSTTAGMGPIQSTSVIVTLSAGALFPTITNFSPGFGGPGTVVTIAGFNFTGVNSVTFGGVPATSFTVVNDGVIQAVVPAGAITGPITVSRPAGMSYPAGSGTSATPFTIGTPPTISSFTPTQGGTGTVIRINGTNFGSLSNIISVNVAGLTAVADSVNPSGTQLFVRITGTATTPRLAPITIATLNGTVTSTQLFQYNLPPIISGVTPGSAIANGRDVPIVINGSNFNINLMPGTGDISGVYFSIVNAPQAISPALRIAVQTVTPTEIRATISGTFNNMPGQRFIIVVNADGQYTSFPFQLIQSPAPTLTSITPSVTTATGVGFVATIAGTNFFGLAGTTVTANGTPLTVVSASPTQLQVLIPASLNQVGATLNIVVRNSDGQQVQGTIRINDAGRPFIERISPPRAIVGSSAVTITITGSGFFLNAEVTFNNIPLQVLSNPARSTTQIVAVIPASLLTTLGSFPIRITNPGGLSNAVLFTVGYPPPTITSVVTASGTMPGQSVTAASVFPFWLAINGSGFRAGLTVTFNNSNLTIISTSDTQVIVQVPASLNRTGVFPVTLSNPDGLSSTATFTIGQPNAPVVTSVFPSVTNATATPFFITINGRNFTPGPQGQPLPGFQVLFNGRALQVISVTATQVIAFVPANVNNQEGNATIDVINPDGQRAMPPGTIEVRCMVCPIITSVSPRTLRPSYPFDVTFTITGSNFRPGATVTVGGVPLRIISITDNQIIAVAPAGFFLSDPRIRVTNTDGTNFTLFDAYQVSVREVINLEAMVARVYPNPVDGIVGFEAHLPKPAQLHVRITDVLGRTLVLFTQAVGAGVFTQQLDVSALPSGVYIIELTDGERRYTEKLLKR